MTFKKGWDWLNYPSVIVIYGETGSGKSATAHSILETMHNKGHKTSMIAPQRLKKFVPEWVEVHGRKLPENHAILIDDAQLHAHSREAYRNINLDKAMSMHRHKDITIIYSTQVAGSIDVNIIRRSDVSVFKQPPLMSNYSEKRDLRKIMEMVDDKFDDMQEKDPNADLRAYSYVISNKPRYEGFVYNELPSYWSEELSKW